MLEIGHTMQFTTLIWVGLGGFAGAIARYVLTLVVTPRVAAVFDAPLPYGTAFVNITGSLLLAMFYVYAGRQMEFPDSARLLIGTGFFGAYTTFSTYANESIALLERGEWMIGLGYIIGTNVLCLLGVVIGLWLANQLF